MQTNLLYILFLSVFNNQTAINTISEGGMTVSWEFEADRIHFVVKAPTNGWVAIGFNSEDKLEGTNLVMGAAEFGHYKMDDQFILGPGKHLSMETIGGEDLLQNRMVTELKNQSIMKFSLPVKASDKFHQDLIKGKQIYLLIACSISDDFMHHSRVRKTLKIKL